MALFLLNELSQRKLQLEEIQQILLQYPSVVQDVESVVGMSPLYLALSRKGCSVAIVKLLLRYGANPNLKLGDRGPTSLFCAILSEEDTVDIVKALIEGGARADYPDDWSMSTALEKNAEMQVIKLLISAGGNLLSLGFFGISPLFFAVKHFDVDAFGSLLDLADVDINTIRNGQNGSLLHSAVVLDGCTDDFVNFLIDRGIDVNSEDGFGNTPLHLAVRKRCCHYGLVDTLLKRRSRVNVRNREGETPLDLAIEKKCNPCLVKWLLKFCLLQDPYFDAHGLIRGHGSRGRRGFKIHAKDCKDELMSMKLEKFSNGRTLLEFLEAYSENQMTRGSTDGFDVDRLLKIITLNLYPIYLSAILSRMERSLWEGKLEKRNVLTLEDSHDTKT